MSNISPSAVYPSSLSDEQGAELDSLCASGNFEMLCCDTSPNVNILEQQYSLNSESTFHLECLSKTSNFTRIKPKTNSP
ncbi:hypothetical protein CEXT_609571 [Caerostris extrusa]|uniref:Uncharacterized protein n=1 Tax=Caerostris extrusa TaxID=172846 RepID=A0AAV4XVV4_CAEEX|nr:hypothetical protein CEXT_609571 [Caerostris extrusa]